MKYMDHVKGIEDLITLLGDFPLPSGEVHRQGDTFTYTSDLLEITANYEKHFSGVTKRQDSVRNISDHPITIRTAMSKFVFNGGIYEVYTQYDENAAESQECWQKLNTEIAARGKELRCSFENAPFMGLYNTGNGRGMAFHIGQNCLWALRARRVIRQSGQRKTVTVEAGVDSSNFSYVLQPGETFRLPPVLCYSFKNKLDMDAYKLHRYCNDLYMKRPLPVTYNTWMSKFDDISYDILAEQVPLAKRLGVEYFVIDAGWFGAPFKWWYSVGDWEECLDASFAGRMGEFADLLRENGMKFGLWFEIERADLASNSYKNHPEYYIVEDDGAFLDFTNPEARAYAYDKLVMNIKKYNIEYIKFDFNATCTFDAKASAFLEYFKGYDLFMRQIKEEFPYIYMEGCASGGMRTSPFTLEYFDDYWLTDQQNIHDQMQIFTKTVKRMPNRPLTTWITIRSFEDFTPCHMGGSTDMLVSGNSDWDFFDMTTISYVLEAMLGSSIGISCNLTMLSEDVLQKLQDQIAKFKQEREFWGMSECHILEDTETATVLQYNDPEFNQIKIQAFVKKNYQNAVTAYPVCTSGAQYALEDGTILNADELAEEGMELALKWRNSAVGVSLKKV